MRNPGLDQTTPAQLSEATPEIPQSLSSQRGPRPDVPRKGTPGYDIISDYSHLQLFELARWIESDTLLRTEEDLIRDMVKELGFKRSGRKLGRQLIQNWSRNAKPEEARRNAKQWLPRRKRS